MVTLEELKLVARAELLRCLDSLPGSKTLIWDPSLVAPFTLFAEPSLLQKHGVDKMVMLPEKGRLAQLPTQSGTDFCPLVTSGRPGQCRHYDFHQNLYNRKF